MKICSLIFMHCQRMFTPLQQDEFNFSNLTSTTINNFENNKKYLTQ